MLSVQDDEPPVGSVVLDNAHDAWQRTDGGWANVWGGKDITWRALLRDYPELRLLHEAPEPPPD